MGRMPVRFYAGSPTRASLASGVRPFYYPRLSRHFGQLGAPLKTLRIQRFDPTAFLGNCWALTVRLGLRFTLESL